MYVHSELLSQEMRPILQNIAISFRYIETARRRKESGNRANLLSVRLSLKKFSPRQIRFQSVDEIETHLEEHFASKLPTDFGTTS